MLSNYFTIAWRNILTNKIYSLIIMLGMVVGLTSSFLIATFVKHEFSYDQHIPKSEHVYRVGFEVLENGVRVGTAKLAPAVAPYLMQNVPSIADATRFYVLKGGISRTRLGQNIFNEENVHFVDANVFEMFPFEFISGDQQVALQNPSSVVLTQSIAEKYFPGQDPIGQSFVIQGTNDVDVNVTGVVKDLPGNTHISSEMLVSIETLKLLQAPDILDTLADARAYTYVKLTSESVFVEFVEDTTKLFKLYEGKGEILTPHFTPVKDIHLFAEPTDNEMKINGNITTVYTYIAIAAVMLLVSAFNFMNIATARSVRRAKEVGIRKVIGATKNMLRVQFLAEALVLTLIALLLSLVLTFVLLPVFGSFVDRELTSVSLLDPMLLLLGLLVSFALAMVSGAYPAFFLSSFSPAKVLKGEVTKGLSGILFRKFLVVGQFTVSVVLLILTIVVYQQMQYAKSERLGYSKDQVLTMKLPAELTQQFDTFRNRLIAIDGVESVSASSRIPTEHLGDMFPLQIDGADYAMYYNLSVGPEFLETYNIGLLSGRGFDRSRSDESIKWPDAENPFTYAKMLVNEAFVKRQGWKIEEAVGKPIEIQLSENPREPLVKTTIIGVINDLKFNTLREQVRPAVYVIQPDNFTRVSIKLSTQGLESTMNQLQAVWTEFLPFEPMVSQFLDVRFDSLYHKENQLGRLFTIFVFIAIILSCLGLLGLVAFSAERRKKEIGIRKVLGATSTDIFKLFLFEFLQMVFVANLIGWPIAYLVARDWLNGFVYRIDFNPMVFVAGLAATVLIAVLTVMFQVRGALKANPVDALSSE